VLQIDNRNDADAVFAHFFGGGGSMADNLLSSARARHRRVEQSRVVHKMTPGNNKMTIEMTFGRPLL
jgi:hypothetical protein